MYGHKQNLASPPRIIDPANPANNLYSSAIGKPREKDDPEEDWKILASRIYSLDLRIPLDRPLDIPRF